MRVIAPITVDNTALTASNVAEADYAEWLVGTAYVIGDRVIVIGTTHKIYECVANNTGNDPTTDTAATYWDEVSATNRWKAFDQKLADHGTNATSITYSILAPSTCDNIAFFGLNAASVRVTVTDTSPALIYDQTIYLTDTTTIVNWLSFYLWPAEYDSEAIFEGVPAYAGYTIDITITAVGATAEVGEIVLGRMHDLGTTAPGTSIGIIDYSRKERDTFGNAIVIERAFASTVNFQFHFPIDDTRRIKRVLEQLRATPAVYYAAADTARFGTNIYGFHQDVQIPLASAGRNFASLEIEGLT